MAGNFGGYVQPQGGGSTGGASVSGGAASGALPAEILFEGTLVAGENISGVRAVALTQSGTLQVAMASVSGRMPAVGITPDNYLSGQRVLAYRGGRLFASGFNFSGFPGQSVFVGSSGHVVASGAPNNSGDIQQILGVTISASGLMVQIGDPLQGVIVGSGALGSGSVMGQAGGGYFTIASGTITTSDIGSGAIVSGLIASGQIGSIHHASGQLTGFELGSGSIVSGRIASGQIGRFHIGSGQLAGFELGSGSIVSGRVASGQIGTNHSASGTVAWGAANINPFNSGISWGIGPLLTGEIISGVRAVYISQSGTLQVAMASISGRMPAIGVVIDGILSGLPANVFTIGAFQTTSGLADYSGCLGKPLWVGRSGQIVTFSGSFNSGGLNVASGADQYQRMGIALNSGGFLASVDNSPLQSQLAGVGTLLIDIVNRGFGV